MSCDSPMNIGCHNSNYRLLPRPLLYLHHVSDTHRLVTWGEGFRQQVKTCLCPVHSPATSHAIAAGCQTQLVSACCSCHICHDAAGHYYNRVHVTSVGCIMWGVCTAGFSVCQSLKEGYLFWAINGIGLSLVIPTGQSLIADYYQVSL